MKYDTNQEDGRETDEHLLFECYKGPLDGRKVYAGEGINTLRTKRFLDEGTQSLYRWDARFYRNGKDIYVFMGNYRVDPEILEDN